MSSEGDDGRMEGRPRPKRVPPPVALFVTSVATQKLLRAVELVTSVVTQKLLRDVELVVVVLEAKKDWLGGPSSVGL